MMRIKTLRHRLHRLKLAHEVLRTGRLVAGFGRWMEPGKLYYLAPRTQIIQITGQYDGGPLDDSKPVVLAVGDSVAIDVETVHLHGEWQGETVLDADCSTQGKSIELRLKFS